MVVTFHPKLPDKIKEYVISSILPDIKYTFLVKENMGKLLAGYTNPKPGSISKKVSDSGLLQVSDLPEAFPYPKLVLACRDMYDATE